MGLVDSPHDSQLKSYKYSFAGCLSWGKYCAPLLSESAFFDGIAGVRSRSRVAVAVSVWRSVWSLAVYSTWYYIGVLNHVTQVIIFPEIAFVLTFSLSW